VPRQASNNKTATINTNKHKHSHFKKTIAPSSNDNPHQPSNAYQVVGLDTRTPDTTVLFQASSQDTPVSAVVYAAAADWWLSTVRPAPLWLFSEFGAVYKYSDLLTYLDCWNSCNYICQIGVTRQPSDIAYTVRAAKCEQLPTCSAAQQACKYCSGGLQQPAVGLRTTDVWTLEINPPLTLQIGTLIEPSNCWIHDD